MKKVIILLILGLIVLVAYQSQYKTTSSSSSSSKEANTYFEVTSTPIKIVTDGQYEVTLDTAATWQFSVQKGQDVTAWLGLKAVKKCCRRNI